MIRRPASRRGRAAGLALAAALAGCATPKSPPALPPDEALRQADVPAQLPAAPGASADTPALDWQAVVLAPRLRQWVALALQHNRDLRVAALNVQRAQAQLGLADASRLPTLGVGLGASRAPNSKGQEANTLTAGVQLSTWEIDLFGRLASLSEAARAQLAASEAGRRAAELSVTAAVLQAALAWQADDELLALARDTLASREQSLALVRLRESVGAASLLDLQAQIGLAAQARASVAQLTRQQAQDGQALALLLGQPVAASAGDAAAGPRLSDEAWLAEVPAGLSSAVLLRRPDVVQAEQSLRAADASVDAARAALWPSITLTAQAGQASAQLSGLFEGGNFVYTVAANALLTVFDSGRRAANVAAAEAAQQIAGAQYQRAIQAAFRDTADALAGRATWQEQVEALTVQRAAARETARLTGLRAAQGAASTLELLEAQRGLWAAEQAVLQARLGMLLNRVALFKALGG